MIDLTVSTKPGPTPRPIRSRLLAKSVPHPTEMHRGHPCWEWKGTALRSGYGQIGVAGRTRYAHRVSYQEFVGPIADGLEIDHLCRNPWCINPSHLEVVTRSVNVRRSESLAGKRSRQTECKYGHLFDEKNTYFNSRGWRECRKCRYRREKIMIAKGTRRR